MALAQVALTTIQCPSMEETVSKLDALDKTKLFKEMVDAEPAFLAKCQMLQEEIVLQDQSQLIDA